MLVATLLLCVGCMLLLAVQRAGWLDEYWTTWHSDPANPLRVAYWSRWIRDTPHPPTFYALAWSLAPLTGPTLVPRRIVVNGLALLLIVPTLLVVRRQGRVPVPTALFGLVLASGPYFITYFAEHRSYFLAMSAVACLVATVRAVHIASDQRNSRLPAPLAIWLFVIALIAANFHYTIALCGLALLFCECVWQWVFASRRTAILIIAAVAVALTPLIANAVTAFGLQTLPVVVDTPLLKGMATLGFMLVVGPAANIVLFLPAALALRSLASSRPSVLRRDPAGSFLMVLAATLLLLTIGFMLLQFWKHNLIPRLLLGLIPLSVALLCELAALAPLRRGLIAAACANAALVGIASTAHELGNGRWEYHVSAILTAIRACPDTRVIAVNPLYLVPRDDMLWSMTGQAAAMELSYRRIAQKWGFRVSVVPSDPIPPAGNCPTLIWMEHNFFRAVLPDRELIAMAGLAAPGPHAHVRRDRADSHDLIEITP